MNSNVLKLWLDDDVLATLTTLLEVALRLPEGADVADHLPSNPWGDIMAFRRELYLPLQGEAPPADENPEWKAVVLDPQDVGPLRDVLAGLGESFSGGVPWVALNPTERDVVSSLLGKLADPGAA